MSVQDGQAVNATVTNAAFISRLTNSNTVAKIDLENIDTTSIIGLQRALNDIMTSIGASHQAATDATDRDYSVNNNILDGDSYKEAIDKLDVALNATQLKACLNTAVDDATFEALIGRAGQAGDLYYNTTEDKIRFYDDSIGAFSDLGGVVSMQREVPAGAINGLNTAFTLSILPLSDEHVSIYVDGRMLNDTEVSISGSNITLTEAPALGQDIFAWYVNEGIVSGITPVPGTRQVEYITLTLADETNEEVTLAATPADNTKVILDIIGGTAAHFGVDYTVSGTTLSWSALTLSGVLAENDVLRVIYDS